jgi:predicted transcriptional regulator
MKTAISVPDDIFEQGERLARRMGRSRSDVYSSALREYVARHSEDEVTAAIDRVIAGLHDGEKADAFIGAAARESLRTTEW